MREIPYLPLEGALSGKNAHGASVELEAKLLSFEIGPVTLSR